MKLSTFGRKAIEKCANTFAKALLRLDKIGYAFVDSFSRTIEIHSRELVRNGIRMLYNTPNYLSDWRVRTFEIKEPETLEWIDSWKCEKDCVFWDIGANMGLYTIYAGLRHNIRVVAVEASVFNCAQLVRNISLNKLGRAVSVINFPLTDQSGIGEMRLSSTVSSSALSTFGEEYGWDGKQMNSSIEYKMLGLASDDLCKYVGKPDYVKIDVDGIEHLILKGGMKSVLTAREILVEVNDAFVEQSMGVESLLKDFGYERVSKSHSEMIAKSKYGFERTFNQIWRKEDV